MTHFNHEWDTTKTPAVPVSVGDRYYAQDLNDDFNYLKHLPYEVFLQGRSRGVMIAPNDTWDNDTNSLTLSGGFGVVLQDCIELDPDEDFVIPPKTHSSPRYERIPFADTVLMLPNDGATHYIVATPTKRSLLQRTKALFTEQYASRIQYDGVITIQDTAPTADQILVGLCHDKEYCLLADNNINQCKDSIILKKWFGQNKITQGFVTILRSYYNTSINEIETRIEISIADGGISAGSYRNCYIKTSGTNVSISGGWFYNCNIGAPTIDDGNFYECSFPSTLATSSINNGNFLNCIFDIQTANKDIFKGGTFHNCTINILLAISYSANNAVNCFSGGKYYDCDIYIGGLNCSGSGFAVPICTGISNGEYNNCSIYIGSLYIANLGTCVGIQSGVFNNCSININQSTTASGITGVTNSANVILNLTKIACSIVSSLSSTGGKLNVLNSAVLHTS